MHVVQFEASPDRWPPLPPPPRNVVASLNTHDTPTFAGYWKGRDIDDQLALGLVDEAGHAAALRQRAELRAKLSRSLGAEDDLDPGTACQRLLELLAGSDARFVLVTLEDMWLEEEPQNVPGTYAERPNWTRRASRSIDEITTDAALRRTLAAIDSRRSPARPTATDTHD
jgi:4-alpha-glucanotransferase